MYESLDLNVNGEKPFFFRFHSRSQVSKEFKQKPLNSIGQRFAEAARSLDCLNMDKARCFKAVVDSKRLVEWLRATIKCKRSQSVSLKLSNSYRNSSEVSSFVYRADA